MKKISRVILLASMASLIAGCSHLIPRKIPVLGLAQNGKDECPVDERIYYYRNADTAICLPDVMVAYSHCVTELTVANEDSRSSSNVSLEVAKALGKVDGLKLSDEQTRELTRAFESAGVIGEARAKAIDTCYELTTQVYGTGDVSPSIKAAIKHVRPGDTAD